MHLNVAQGRNYFAAQCIRIVPCKLQNKVVMNAIRILSKCILIEQENRKFERFPLRPVLVRCEL